jgi:argininosuccinate lyase
VAWCTAHGRELHEVSDEQLARVSPHLTPDVRSVLDVRGALAARTGHGGTAPVRVREQLAALRGELAAARAWAGR